VGPAFVGRGGWPGKPGNPGNPWLLRPTTIGWPALLLPTFNGPGPTALPIRMLTLSMAVSLNQSPGL